MCPTVMSGRHGLRQVPKTRGLLVERNMRPYTSMNQESGLHCTVDKGVT